MAVAYVMDFANGTTDQYDRVVELMGLGDEPPEGALFHAVGVTDSGLRVTDVWESDEAFERFAADQIGPHTATVGLGQPVVQRLPITDTVQGSGVKPTFVQLVKMPGLSRDAFNEADGKIRPDGAAPAGMTHHANGETDEGSFVLDAWESKEIRDAFMGPHVAPVMQDAPLTGPPSIEELPLHNVLIRTPA